MAFPDMGLMINKICIDSRFRSGNSRSDTDFSIELPESILLPPGTKCYVTDISIVHAWYTIEQNVNDKLYFTYKYGGNRYDKILTFPSMNYTLQTLTDMLRDLMLDMLIHVPDWMSMAFSAVVAYDENTGTISIRNLGRGQFNIWTGKELKDQTNFLAWTGPYYDKLDPQSVNHLLRNDTVKTYDVNNPFVSGFVDTLTHHNIYIKSPQLGTFQNIGPQGERDILKKVLVDVGFGELITDYGSTLLQDFTDCSRMSLRTLNFRVTDVNNNPLNLHGHHVSFSLVFTLE
jgi:hypothetical protein